MRTPDLSDEELDALFRQGAERYPEELNLGAWARMEQKLDEAHVQQLVNRKVARLFAAEIGIVAVLLLIWGGYREVQPPATVAPTGSVAVENAGVPKFERATSAAAARINAPTSAQPGAAEAGVKPGGSSAPSAPTPTAAPAEPSSSIAAATPSGTTTTVPSRRKRHLTPAVALASTETPGATTAANESDGATVAQSKSRRRRQATANATPLVTLLAGAKRQVSSGREASNQTAESVTRAQVPGQTGAANSPAANAELAGNSAGRKAQAAGVLQAQAATALTVSENPVAPPYQAEAAAARQRQSATLVPAETQSEANALTAETLLPRQAALRTLPGEALPELLPADSVVRRQPRPYTPSRLFITGLYAPELSTVRNAGFDKPGYSAGVQVEYLLLPRLRLNVGLLSSLKHYQARGADYTWYRPPMYPVDRVEGTCRITDVPVNLRFDAWQGVRQRAFVSAGLSSLLMRDEQYYYNYTSSYGASYTRSWQVKKGSRHLFSVVNLSAGVERQLSLRWSVQAEPYVKVPLGGVGAGKVRLSSGGVFFGLKYGL